MTLRQLLTFFENYYGEKYSGVVLDTVTAYLDGYSAEFYRAAAEVLPKRFSRVWNKAPCPAEFEKHMDEIQAMLPKRETLPEPRHEITDAEREECQRLSEEWKSSRGGKPGPLAGVLAGIISRDS